MKRTFFEACISPPDYALKNCQAYVNTISRRELKRLHLLVSPQREQYYHPCCPSTCRKRTRDWPCTPCYKRNDLRVGTAGMFLVARCATVHRPTTLQMSDDGREVLYIKARGNGIDNRAALADGAVDSSCLMTLDFPSGVQRASRLFARSVKEFCCTQEDMENTTTSYCRTCFPKFTFWLQWGQTSPRATVYAALGCPTDTFSNAQRTSIKLHLLINRRSGDDNPHAAS